MQARRTCNAEASGDMLLESYAEDGLPNPSCSAPTESCKCPRRCRDRDIRRPRHPPNDSWSLMACVLLNRVVLCRTVLRRVASRCTGLPRACTTLHHVSCVGRSPLHSRFMAVNSRYMGINIRYTAIASPLHRYCIAPRVAARRLAPAVCRRHLPPLAVGAATAQARSAAPAGTSARALHDAHPLSSLVAAAPSIHCQVGQLAGEER